MKIRCFRFRNPQGFRYFDKLSNRKPCGFLETSSNHSFIGKTKIFAIGNYQMIM